MNPGNPQDQVLKGVKPGESDEPTEELVNEMVDLEFEYWNYLLERTWNPVRKRFEFPQRTAAAAQRPAKLVQFALISFSKIIYFHTSYLFALVIICRIIL